MLVGLSYEFAWGLSSRSSGVARQPVTCDSLRSPDDLDLKPQTNKVKIQNRKTRTFFKRPVKTNNHTLKTDVSS